MNTLDKAQYDRMVEAIMGAGLPAAGHIVALACEQGLARKCGTASFEWKRTALAKLPIDVLEDLYAALIRVKQASAAVH